MSKTETGNESGEVHGVSLKLPPFWPGSISTWFIQVESQFKIYRIVNESTKYNYLVAALPQDIAESLTDILDEPSADTPYSSLKEAIISRNSLSIERRIKKIISDEEIGDRKPSEFYRRLKQLAGSSGTVGDELIKKLWLARLPNLINISLIPFASESIDKILDTADKIWDAMQSTTEVSAIGSHRATPTSTSFSSSATHSTFSSEKIEPN